MIKILSESTINRIAAGEVIERPASVIKELVENSIDAGATKINIILEQAGKNLIVISDDGSGMSPEDLELAIKRHATSKLDEENLDDIDSFGFRGEALPSISSISKLTITSKRKNHDKAYSLSQIGGKETSLKQTNHEIGTKTEVRDLFFATPARLKFLRTDKTEFAACADVIRKLALAHPHISFSASHDNKIFLKVKGNSSDGRASAIKQRILDVLGKDFISNSAELNLTRDSIHIYGFTSIPSYHRSSLEDQHLFVNNRPVKDKILNMAVRNAYSDFVALGRYPTIVLFLDINPKDIDVNVHPAKSEVRFSDPNSVRSLVVSSIRDALSTNITDFKSNISANPLGYFGGGSSASYINPLLPNSSFSRTYIDQNQKHNFSPSLNEQNYNNSKAFTIPLLDAPNQHNTVIAVQPNDSILENFILGSAKAQLGYHIVAKTLKNIIVIDMRVAAEQLCYEKIKQQLADNKLTKKRMLMPEVVELKDEQQTASVFNKKEHLSKLGLSIEKFGNKALIISELPTLIDEINIIQFINELADYLVKNEENENITDLTEYVIKSYASYHAMLSNKKLDIHEINQLLREIEQSSFFKKHKKDRQFFIELNTTDLEKFFNQN